MSVKRTHLVGLITLLFSTVVIAQPLDINLQKALQSATAYEEAGQTGLALRALRDWRAQHSQLAPSIDFQLKYASLLLQQQQEVEALGVLRTLQNQTLNPEQEQKFYDLQLDYSTYHSLRLLSAHETAAAAEVIAPVIATRPNSAKALYASGKVALAQGKKEQAYAQLKKSIELSKEQNPTWFLDLADAAISQGENQEARRALQQAIDLGPENISVLLGAQAAYGKLGEHSEVGQLERKITLLRSAQLPVLPSEVGTKVQLVEAPPTNMRQSSLLPPSRLQAEYDAIMSERSGNTQVGLYTVQRKGDSGSSRLSRFEQPVEVTLPFGDNKVALELTPVQLSSGRVKDDLYSISAFGSGPTAATQQMAGIVGPPGRQQQRGVGVTVKYVAEGLEADIGVTPIGFEYKNLTGGIKLAGTLNSARAISYKLNISRRPVTESLLSFAGTKDERTGQRWGAVTATGIRGDISKEFGSYGIYAAAAWHVLRGKNVANNQRQEINLGTYTHLFDEIDELLMLGLNLNATFFDKNQRYFTYGHGGYFSPQHSYGLALPLSWAVRDEKISYIVNSSIGVTRFKEHAADLHPTNAYMQADAVRSLAANPQLGLGGLARGYYPGQKKTTFNYGLNAAVEYRMTPQVHLGAQAAVDNANDYRQWAGGLFLRYYFYPQTKKLNLPLKAYSSPYNQGKTYGQ